MVKGKGKNMISKIEPYKGIAAVYDEIRPSYPESLIQDVISKTDVKYSDSILEIGPGTGKATIQFAEKGFAIHGVESGEDMAAIFREKCAKYEKVSLDVVPFEQWKCQEDKRYDMIFSAQTFHWLDPEVKYERCHKLLKDNGYLVLFWYTPSDDELPETREIEDKINDIIERYTLNYSVNKGKPERRAHNGEVSEDERKAEIEASGLFHLVEKLEYTQETRNNARQYLKVRKSVPAFASILDKLDEKDVVKMDSEIEEVINSYGGYLGTKFEFTLYIAKKVSEIKG
jgi:SAM-dependent methyltransferase